MPPYSASGWYALLTAVFGWMGDHNFGFDAHGVGHVDQPHPISGTVVATFITGFGGGGTVAHYLLEWSLLPGLLAASATGAVMAGAAFGVLELVFSRPEVGSEFKTTDAAGRIAEVITTIPAEGIGEIAYVVKGQHERAGARAVDDQLIKKGKTVVIERIMGTTAYVRLQSQSK